MQADQQRVNARRATINTGDYANAKDFVSNKDKLAEQNTIRKNALSLAPTGASAIALQYANPNQIALTQTIADNEFARDQAAQAEDDVRNYMAETDAQEQNLINRQIGINQSVMGEGFQQSNYNLQQAAQIAAQRQAALSQMVGMALGGFANFALPGISAATKLATPSASSIFNNANNATRAGLSTTGSLTTQPIALR